MTRLIHSALFVLWFVLTLPNLGVAQQPNLSEPSNPAAQKADGREAGTTPGQEPGKGKAQPDGQSRAGRFPLAQSTAPPPTILPDSLHTILSAQTLAVVGMTGSRCYGPGCISAKEAKKAVEQSLRKWGRFTLLDDPKKADLVVVVMESFDTDSENYQAWSQVRVFKGPVTRDFPAEVQKRLRTQLRTYTGPVALEKEPQLLWEGWRRTGAPALRNPAAGPRPGVLASVLSSAVQSAQRQGLEKEVQNCADKKVSCSEAENELGEANRELFQVLPSGSSMRKLDTLVIEDFCTAFAEAEKSVGTAPLPQP